MKKIHATCTLCQHFDSNRAICQLNGQEVNPLDYELPKQCQDDGKFMRNLNVLLESYHYYTNDQDIPFGWEPDLTRLPKDSEGVPLFVYTKRGLERALPAAPGVTLMGDILVGVKKIMTYQGQREIIFDLGIDIAKIEAERAGVPLHVLPEEEGCQGTQELKAAYHHKQGRYRNPKTDWISEEPIESW